MGRREKARRSPACAGAESSGVAAHDRGWARDVRDAVTAGEDWLASRWLLRERRVRTDLLVSVRCLEGVSQRLLLRDAFGARVAIDPDVLVNNPGLWHRFEVGARKAVADGLLLCGQTAVRRLSARVDRETALAVFKASGLE
ncbi:hypothetical protein ABT298_11355 [Streptomyces sp. NPDC001034]|uniref:hypothetical protein n=1 Tax=Streptomyces sp. NPDC001034 TaxID=3154375 RepID=UPI00332BAD2F